MKLYQRIVAAIFTVSLLLASYTASTLAQSDDEVDDVPAFTPTTEATAPSLRIEIGTPEATSTPTLLPTETSTLEPEPSATTLLPTETSTAEPTSGTTETETPLPTNTPGQTSTPVVTATTPPAETNTPQPTETLEPQPTSTPKETVAPETSPTPEPSPTSSSPTVGII